MKSDSAIASAFPYILYSLYLIYYSKIIIDFESHVNLGKERLVTSD